MPPIDVTKNKYFAIGRELLMPGTIISADPQNAALQVRVTIQDVSVWTPNGNGGVRIGLYPAGKPPVFCTVNPPPQNAQPGVFEVAYDPKTFTPQIPMDVDLRNDDGPAIQLALDDAANDPQKPAQVYLPAGVYPIGLPQPASGGLTPLIVSSDTQVYGDGPNRSILKIADNVIAKPGGSYNYYATAFINAGSGWNAQWFNKVANQPGFQPPQDQNSEIFGLGIDGNCENQPLLYSGLAGTDDSLWTGGPTGGRGGQDSLVSAWESNAQNLPKTEQHLFPPGNYAFAVSLVRNGGARSTISNLITAQFCPPGPNLQPPLTFTLAAIPFPFADIEHVDLYVHGYAGNEFSDPDEYDNVQAVVAYALGPPLLCPYFRKLKVPKGQPDVNGQYLDDTFYPVTIGPDTGLRFTVTNGLTDYDALPIAIDGDILANVKLKYTEGGLLPRPASG